MLDLKLLGLGSNKETVKIAVYGHILGMSDSVALPEEEGAFRVELMASRGYSEGEDVVVL